MAALGLLCFACGRRRRPKGPPGVRDTSDGEGADGCPTAKSVAAAATASASDEVDATEAMETCGMRTLGGLSIEKGVDIVSNGRVGGWQEQQTTSNGRPVPASKSLSAPSDDQTISGQSTARSVDQGEKRGEEGADGQDMLDFSALTRIELLSAATNKAKVDCARRRTATQRRPPSKEALRRILRDDQHADDNCDEGHAKSATTGVATASKISAELTAAIKRRAQRCERSPPLGLAAGQLILPPARADCELAPTPPSGSGSAIVSQSLASDRKKRGEIDGTRRATVNVGAVAPNTSSRKKYTSQPINGLGRDSTASADDDDARSTSAVRQHSTAALSSVTPPRTPASKLSLSKMTTTDGSRGAPANVADAIETPMQLTLSDLSSAVSEALPVGSRRGSPNDQQLTLPLASDVTAGAASACAAARSDSKSAPAGSCDAVTAAGANANSAPASAADDGTPVARTVVSLKQWLPLLPPTPARRTHCLHLYHEGVGGGGRRTLYASQPSLAASASSASGNGALTPAAKQLRCGTSLSWMQLPPSSVASGSQLTLSVGDWPSPRRPTAAFGSTAGTKRPSSLSPTVYGQGRCGSRSHLPEADISEHLEGRALLGSLAADMHPPGCGQDAPAAPAMGAAGGCAAAPGPQPQLESDFSSRNVSQCSKTKNGTCEAAASDGATAIGAEKSNGTESPQTLQLLVTPPLASKSPPSPQDEIERQLIANGEANGDISEDATDAEARQQLPASTPPESPHSNKGGDADSSAFVNGFIGSGGYDEASPSSTPVSFSRSRLASAEIRMPESVAARSSSAAEARQRPPPPTPPLHTPTPSATVGWRLARDDAPLPAAPPQRPPWWRPTRVAATVDDDATETAARPALRSRSLDQGLSRAACASMSLSPKRPAADRASAEGVGTATPSAAATAATPPPQPVVRRSHSIAATVSPTAASCASIPSWVLMAADKSRRLSRLFKDDAYGSTSALEDVTVTATQTTTNPPPLPPSRPQVVLHRGRVASAPSDAGLALSPPPTPQADVDATSPKEEEPERPAVNGHRIEVGAECRQQLNDTDHRCSQAAAAEVTTIAINANTTAVVVPVAGSDSPRSQCSDAVQMPALTNGKDGGGGQLQVNERASLTNGDHLHNGPTIRRTNGAHFAGMTADARHRSASEYQSPEVDVTRKLATLRRSQSAAARFTRPSAAPESGAVEEPEFVKLARARLARRREAGIIAEEDDC